MATVRLATELRQALDLERMATARRINPLRFLGVGIFWSLFCLLGELLHQPLWRSDFRLLTGYLLLSAILFFGSARSGSVARRAGYALAFFDLPFICAVQASTMRTSSSSGAVAGFTIAVNVMLVALSALSLDGWQVLATALVGTALGIFLQLEAGISVGAMLSTVAVMGFAAVSGYALIVRFIKLTSQLLEQAEERKEMQSRLFLADRMATVGTLAASVAHEVSNPMTYVLGNLELLQQRMEKNPNESGELREWVRAAHAGAQHVARITRDLKGFARQDEETVHPIKLKPVVETTLSVASAEIKPKAQLETNYQSVPDVLANEGRLTQVLLNLLVNAAQAIPVGDPQKHCVKVVLRSEDANRVVIAISDTGGGISPEHQRRLFQSFFTTKPRGQGTGLGLSISWEIVRNLGGIIRVQSELGKGSTFEVVLPAAGSPPLSLS
jgi:signal transduction histidine kinase